MVTRTIPGGLASLIAPGQVPSLATLWTITRKDGTILRFTDHDADIIIGGVTYKAAVGYERTAVEANSNLAVGGMDVRGILDSTRIDENDLRAGRYDYADVEILLVDWDSPASGTAIIQTGKLGEIIYAEREGTFSTELRDISQAYSQRIIEAFVVPCRADFGDARCNNANPGIFSQRNPTPVLPPVVQTSTVYALDDVVRIRDVVADVCSLAAPGSVDDDDDSQYAAVGTTGSDAAAADTNKLHHLAGNFRFQPVGGPTQNPSNSFISWPDADQHTIGLEPFTVEMWVNFDAIDLVTTGSGPILASKYTATGNQRSWLIAVVEDGGSEPGLKFTAYDGTSSIGSLAVPLTTFTPEINVWYHIAVSRDEKYKLRIFLDGEVLAAGDFPYAIFGGTALTRLGMFDSVAGGNRHFEGSIEDFRMTIGGHVYSDEFTPTGPLAATFADPLNLTEDYSDTHYRVSVAGTTAGALPIMPGTYEPTPDTGVTTLDVGSTSTFTRPAGSFIDDGFLLGQTITTTGFTDGANNGTFTISGVAATTLTITASSLVVESGGGNEQIVVVFESNTVTFLPQPALRVAADVREVTDRKTFVIGPPSVSGGLLTEPLFIENPGFETGDITGWTQTLGASTISTQSNSGTYSLQLPTQWSGGGSYAHVSQTRLLTGYEASVDTGTQTITTRWWMRNGSILVPTGLWLDYHFLDEDDILISQTAGTKKGAGNDWVQKSQTNTIPVGTRSIIFEMNGGESINEAKFDDVTVETTLTDANFGAGELEYGVLTFDTGLNAQVSMEIKSWDPANNQVTLYESMPLPITVGDKLAVHKGCNREASRCKEHGNIANYRGFRFIPGDLKINRAPGLA